MPKIYDPSEKILVFQYIWKSHANNIVKSDQLKFAMIVTTKKKKNRGGPVGIWKL